MTIRVTPLLLLPVLLAACASGAPKTTAVGAGPAPDSAFRFAAATADAWPLQPLVEARLRALGLTSAENGRYLVEVSFGERPITVGAFEQDGVPAKRDDPAWRRAPSKPAWWKDPNLRACVLSVRVSEAQDGQEVYRVDAETRRRKARCADVAPRLVDAALPAIPLPSRAP